MILENGFVKITGATDLEDSSMAAGVCAVFNYPIQADLYRYIRIEDGMYQRCENSKYLFSRDQFICLAAGYRASGRIGNFYVNADRINGKDLLSPSAKGHIKRCQGLKASWFQDAWLWMDIWFHATFTPREEPNQLLCMMMIADVKFLRYWCEANSLWEFSIRDYWSGWRGESELAEHMIGKIKGAVKTP